jgi:hypothetical protein
MACTKAKIKYVQAISSKKKFVQEKKKMNKPLCTIPLLENQM